MSELRRQSGLLPYKAKGPDSPIHRSIDYRGADQSHACQDISPARGKPRPRIEPERTWARAHCTAYRWLIRQHGSQPILLFLLNYYITKGDLRISSGPEFCQSMIIRGLFRSHGHFVSCTVSPYNMDNSIHRYILSSQRGWFFILKLTNKRLTWGKHRRWLTYPHHYPHPFRSRSSPLM